MKKLSTWFWYKNCLNPKSYATSRAKARSGTEAAELLQTDRMNVIKSVTGHPVHSVRPREIQKNTQIWSRSLGETEPNLSEALNGSKKLPKIFDRIFSPLLYGKSSRLINRCGHCSSARGRHMWALKKCLSCDGRNWDQNFRRWCHPPCKVEAMVTSEACHRVPSTPGVMHTKTSPCTGRKRGTQAVFSVQTNNFLDQKS